MSWVEIEVPEWDGNSTIQEFKLLGTVDTIADVSASTLKNKARRQRQKARNLRIKEEQRVDAEKGVASDISKEKQKGEHSGKNNHAKKDEIKKKNSSQSKKEIKDKPKKQKSDAQDASKLGKKRKLESVADPVIEESADAQEETTPQPPQKKKKLAKVLKSPSKPNVEKQDKQPKQSPIANNVANASMDKRHSKLKGAQFRWLNEQMYTTSGGDAHQLFQNDPTLFTLVSSLWCESEITWIGSTTTGSKHRSPSGQVIQWISSLPG
jgi:ribosomal RNA-processing protein 8